MKKYYFPLGKYAVPSQFLLDLECYNIKRYIYGIFFNNIVIKYGQGTTDRVARQVEGFYGWNKEYDGWAAKELRKNLLDADLYDQIHKDSVVVTIDDYTTETSQILNKYGKDSIAYVKGFITNREREAILKESTRPPLNKVVPPKCLEAPILPSTLWEIK